MQELPFGERSAKHILFHIFKQIVNYKKQDSSKGEVRTCFDPMSTIAIFFVRMHQRMAQMTITLYLSIMLLTSSHLSFISFSFLICDVNWTELHWIVCLSVCLSSLLKTTNQHVADHYPLTHAIIQGMDGYQDGGYNMGEVRTVALRSLCGTEIVINGHIAITLFSPYFLWNSLLLTFLIVISLYLSILILIIIFFIPLSLSLSLFCSLSLALALSFALALALSYARALSLALALSLSLYLPL